MKFVLTISRPRRFVWHLRDKSKLVSRLLPRPTLLVPLSSRDLSFDPTFGRL